MKGRGVVKAVWVVGGECFTHSGLFPPWRIACSLEEKKRVVAGREERLSERTAGALRGNHSPRQKP